MSVKIFQLVFVIFCFNWFCVVGLVHNLSVDNTTSQTILQDIQNAFKMVMNSTKEMHQILPQMYDLSVRHTNPMFIFKIPKSNKDYSMLFMERSDFMEPIFPNLTTQYMSQMKNKLQKFSDNMNVHTNESKNEVFVKVGVAGMDQQQLSEKNDWSIFGLDGWTGEISHPVNSLPNASNEEYPNIDVLNDFTLEGIDAKIMYNPNWTERANNSEIIAKEKQNIYIARVNDPFGYSTKWELRYINHNGSQNLVQFNKSDDRTKRDVIKLYSMIKCSTGCEPLVYKGYGCYCGFLGGGIPVNGIDRCCKLHDKCYEHSNCISYLEYFVPYVWKCYRGKPLCAIDHGEWGGPQSCAARLCNCDLRLSRCLKQFTCPRRRAVCTSSLARQLQNFIFT